MTRLLRDACSLLLVKLLPLLLVLLVEVCKSDVSNQNDNGFAHTHTQSARHARITALDVTSSIPAPLAERFLSFKCVRENGKKEGEVCGNQNSNLLKRCFPFADPQNDRRCCRCVCARSNGV
jgi:hypothetical protein